MIPNQKVRDIKKLQKESTILRALLSILPRTIAESAVLQKISFTRASLNKDNSQVTIYVYSSFGRDVTEEAIKELIDYVRSIRGSLASLLQFRYMPKLRFTYDGQEEKIAKINEIIDKARENDNKIHST